MKVLSIKEPYATLICNGKKLIETFCIGSTSNHCNRKEKDGGYLIMIPIP